MARFEVESSTQISSQSPLFTVNFLPKPSHLPFMFLFIGVNEKLN
jgi:hypothetical protein